MTYVYHFTRRENVPTIMQQGLNVVSRFNKLNSKLREKAIYAWLIPQHDKMGYLNDGEYVCLQIRVEPQDCFVANMDIISSAFVNFIGTSKQERNISLSKELVSYYDSSAVHIGEYKTGLFRVPEVIIPYHIESKDIEICPNIDSYQNSNLIENEMIYNENWFKRVQFLANDYTNKREDIMNMLSNTGLIKKIAMHDDSDGLLATYELIESKEYFTIKLSEKINI
ncbi:hypothetical protein [Inconstantimicrobium mannanitabidum]|uniref:Uncharacterized protein n=1 Tax=Inconstantimicrobium mannanitabidum TaxID=1604901 RepID=A0ACB5RCB7_9CLOT|nr:hypothetical protein [Clostridium sp. TW13]GKX66725.1 hypothetical protein rsdtw13_19830 [Clostridium sp. TW13]